MGALHGTSAPRHVMRSQVTITIKAPLPGLLTIGAIAVEIMVLICHVTLHDHMTKLFSDFLVRTPARYVTILLSLLAIGTVTKIL